MPNPKRRHSQKRGRLRRTFYKVKMGNLAKCPQCAKSILPHRICPFCGYYKGKEQVQIMSKEEKRKAREKKQKS